MLHLLRILRSLEGRSTSIAVNPVARMPSRLRWPPKRSTGFRRTCAHIRRVPAATVRLLDDTGDQLVVPRAAIELLARILAHMASGHGVSVVPATLS